MPSLPVFRLEEYLSQWEFIAPYLLCCSDSESYSLEDILSLADRESKQLWQSLSLGYTEVAGLPILRREIATLYPGLSEEDIFCFAGAEEGIFCSMQALLTPEDHVIVKTPCYQSLEAIPKYTGAKVTSIALKESENWNISLDSIRSAIKPNTKIIVINFPHNPTGSVLTEQQASQLVELASSRDIYIFSDEVYRLLGPSSTEWNDPIAARYTKGISLGVMSKAFGLAGLRLGWIATKDNKAIEKIKLVKHYTSICNSAPSEILALIALRAKDTILRRNVEIVDNNLKHLDTFFENHKEILSWVRPKGGCVGFVRYQSPHPVDRMCEALLSQEGVLLLPARIYDYPENYFRIGFGRKNMLEAIERFDRFLKGWHG